MSRFASVFRMVLLLCVAAGVMIGLHRHGSRAETAAGSARIALVIGNADYDRAALPTSLADAGLVARSLAKAGFDVTAMADVDADTLRRTVDGFADRMAAIGPHALCVVYLAGYGLQVDGDNYFVPVHAAISRAESVPTAAIKLTEIFRRLEALPARGRLFVLDLARANAFAKEGPPLAGGLAMTTAALGDAYAFNAAPGTIASPDLLPYGAYARAFSEMLAERDLGVAALLRRVRLRVGEETNGATVPWDDVSLDPDISLSSPQGETRAAGATPLDRGGGPRDAATAYSTAVADDTLHGYADYLRTYPADPLASRIKAMLAVRLEATYWSESLRAGTARAFWTYMRRYPRGPHLGDARRMLAFLGAALEPPPRFDLLMFEGLSAPAPDDAEIVDRSAISFTDPSWPTIPAPPADLVPPRKTAFYGELQPPPIVPQGVVPVPLVDEGSAESGTMIVQPLTIGFGLIRVAPVRSGGGDLGLDYRVGTRVLLEAKESVLGGARVISERTADGETISTSSATTQPGSLIVVQTGPAGEILSRAVTTRSGDGRSATVVTDGSGAMLAASTLNDNGIRTDAKQGRVAVADEHFVYVPPAITTGHPTVTSFAELPRVVPVSPGTKVAAPVPKPSDTPPDLPGASIKPIMPPMDLPGDETTSRVSSGAASPPAIDHATVAKSTATQGAEATRAASETRPRNGDSDAVATASSAPAPLPPRRPVDAPSHQKGAARPRP